jgi:hypothetical protein
MYVFLVSNLETGVTGITFYNHMDDALSAYEEHQCSDGDDKFVIRCVPGEPFGLNEKGSFGGTEIVSNLYG